MKVDRDAKASIETGESVQPDSQTSPQEWRNEEIARKQTELLADPAVGLSTDLFSNEAEAVELTVKVKNLAEKRHEKMASIKDAIQRGNYHISVEQTAEAILSEMEARAESHGLADKERKEKAANSVRSEPAEPLTLYSRQESGSNRRRRCASLASSEDEIRREDSEPSHDETDRSS
jgi:anti-sigma28 factor (negative regulator of flagellin synthesis)